GGQASEDLDRGATSSAPIGSGRDRPAPLPCHGAGGAASILFQDDPATRPASPVSQDSGEDCLILRLSPGWSRVRIPSGPTPWARSSAVEHLPVRVTGPASDVACSLI